MNALPPEERQLLQAKLRKYEREVLELAGRDDPDIRVAMAKYRSVAEQIGLARARAAVEVLCPTGVATARRQPPPVRQSDDDEPDY